jgi:hypothetical protein
MDGGRSAAFGLRYQYLRTFEALLDAAEQPGRIDRCFVEGRTLPASDDDPAPEVVDYELTDDSGGTLQLVQVKATGQADRRLSESVVLKIFLELCRTPSEEYVLVTNCLLTKGIETLKSLLSSREPTRAIRTALKELVSRSPGTLRSLREVPDERVERLRSCRIVQDGRNDRQLREDLRTRLRQYRSANRSGSSYVASGLLLGYLLEEIFARAASPSEDALTVERIRQLLAVEAAVLAQALGRVDWGLPIGAPAPFRPDVLRQETITQLGSEFASGLVDRVAYHVLSGPSGIGKSSIAAAYSSEYADRYDRVIWVDAEAENSIQSSFQSVISSGLMTTTSPMSGSQGERESSSLHADVAMLLASYPGPWLAVFDNATDPALIEPWLPRVGRGHVLITTTNESGWIQFRRTQIGPMLNEEAVELVAHRFRRTPQQFDAEEHLQIESLVVTMEGWPLALEMACGYLISAGMTVTEIPTYLSVLRSALDRESLVPTGYPRTLVQAILLCIARIADKAALEALPKPCPAAMQMLVASAYLSARNIPLHFLWAASLIEPASVIEGGLRGPMIQLGGEYSALDALAVLKSESLVRTAGDDRDLGTASRIFPEAISSQLSLNEITQEIVRRRVEFEDPPSELLAQIAFHLQGWLSGFVDERDFGAAIVLQPHAAVLAKHAVHLQVDSPWVALLFGNSAVSLTAQGYWLDALNLFAQEREYLSRGYGSPKLEMKIASALAGCHLHLSSTVEEVAKELETALALASSILAEYVADEAAASTIYNLKSILSTLERHDSGENERLQRLRLALEQIIPGLPWATAGSDVRSGLTQLESLHEQWDEGRLDDEDLVKKCDSLLKAQQLPFEGRLLAVALIAEASSYASDWARSESALHELTGLVAQHHSGHSEVVLYGCNIGYVVAFVILSDRVGQNVYQFFQRLMELMEAAIAHAPNAMQEHGYRVSILRAFRAALEPDAATMSRFLNERLQYKADTLDTRANESGEILVSYTLRLVHRLS